ncbi:hypothetical protein F0562_006645 [Nyssa sinensis]|uniref:Uncharacterized protein n=1 Tax=Nyssa sinensis TaxID=561372 RepID=A0A5J5AN43_9ASTE|nr:hypothetical protein F0562_006645 [Nyssa sinensis]
MFDDNIPVPEFEKFRSLQSQSYVIISDANTMIQDEFVETQYYQQLDSIDTNSWILLINNTIRLEMDS